MVEVLQISGPANSFKSPIKLASSLARVLVFDKNVQADDEQSVGEE